MNNKSGVRLQNCGVNNASKLDKRIAVWLGKDAGKCTEHSFRRSVSVALVNVVSTIALCHYRRYRSSKVTQVRAEHIDKEKEQRVNGLA